MEVHRKQTFHKIDAFFQQVIEMARARAEELKEEFAEVEAEEKIRLESYQTKLAGDAALA